MKQIFFILILFGLIACKDDKPVTKPKENVSLTEHQIDSILTAFKFEYDTPIVLDSSDQILIPISTDLLESKKSYTKDGYESYDFPRYWNVLFYNRASGQTNILTENKINISNIYAKKSEEYMEGSKVMPNIILYEIADIDFNKDEILNSNDPLFLFSSKVNGEELKRISPPNEDVRYFEVVPNSNQILIRTVRNVNNDLSFDNKDQLIWYKAELTNNDWKLSEIIDSTKRKKIETLYFEQWLKNK